MKKQIRNKKREKTIFKKITFAIIIGLLMIWGIAALGSFYRQSFYESVPTKSLMPLSPTANPLQQWFIKQKTPEGEKIVYEFDRNGLNFIARWNDSLFYSYYFDKELGEDKGLQLTVYEYNIKTGKTVTLFTKASKNLAVTSLKVLDNTLFFSLGAYLTPGEMYWINLSQGRSVQQLIYANEKGYGIPQVQKIGNNYFFITSEGDACSSVADYSLLDMQTKKLTSIAQTSRGCGDGIEYLGIDAQNRMLLAPHTGGSEIAMGRYTSVFAKTLQSQQQKQEIISMHVIPANISLIKYRAENNSLVLFGDTVYDYSLSSQKLRTIASLPTEWRQNGNAFYTVSFSENTVCVSKSKENDAGALAYRIDLDSGVLSRDDDCPDKFKSRGVNTVLERDSLFKSLDLSKEYILSL